VRTSIADFDARSKLLAAAWSTSPTWLWHQRRGRHSGRRSRGADPSCDL